MGQSQIEKWNERYREGLDDLPIPLSFFVDFASTLAPGRALDLACGAGRHSIWLAERGWQVDAVDGSAVAIEQLKQRGLQVRARVADIEAAEFRIEEGEYDLIVDTFFLHRPLFPMIREALRPGGWAVLAFHRTGTFGIEVPELDRLFSNWSIVQQVVYDQPPTVELIVQKPLIA